VFSRSFYAGLFSVLILALIACTVSSIRHHKALGKAVARLDLAFIPPILGNALIFMAQRRYVALIGCYTYYIGMDLVIFELLRFTEAYCKGAGKHTKAPRWPAFVLAVDALQLLANIFTAHAFKVDWTVYNNEVFYIMKPLIGQAFHRIVDYGFFLAIIITFAINTFKASRIYRERYSIILVTMIAVGVWETIDIFAKIPIDRSMIGLGAFGILVYYFSIHYRPLKLLDRMLSGIVSNGNDACFIFTPRGRCVWVNKAASVLVGVKEDDCGNAPELVEYLFNTKLRKGNWSEQHFTGAGECMRYYLLENRDVVNEKGIQSGYYLKVKDITEEQLKIRRNLYEATHDRLTGLYTKEHLFQAIKSEIDVNKNNDYMILFVNIKSFKVVNDIFGNDFGDYAISSFADKFREFFSKGCLYGRLAGATFGVLIPKDEYDEHMIEQEFALINIKKDKAKYPLQIQIGVYEVDREVTDVSIMFSNARLALSTIESDDAKHIAYYDEDLRNEILWDQELTAQLADAIKNRDIRPYLQPIADSDGNIVGCEALARWIHKDYGFLAPIRFIPSLEKNGLIAEIDRYMWRCSCEILSAWKKRGWDMFLSVNISPKDFYYMDVPKYIKGLVREYGLEPRQLRVEITESVMVNDADKIIAIMDEFRDAGFIVEMDDFGSGYSSLNMLKTLPVDVLKIDMNFLGKSDDEQRADTIVKNIINLSLDLGMTALTEGVETQDQYDGLAEMGCKLFQGYYFSKPLPVDELEELVIVKNK